MCGFRGSSTQSAGPDRALTMKITLSCSIPTGNALQTLVDCRKISRVVKSCRSVALSSILSSNFLCFNKIIAATRQTSGRSYLTIRWKPCNITRRQGQTKAVAIVEEPELQVENHADGMNEDLQSQSLTSSQFPSCPKWNRVLLKVSGEALAGDGKANVDPKVTSAIAKEVASITRLGVEVAIVVGGGNFFRGASWVGASGLDRASADQIGMMATVMNAIFMQASLESIGVPTRVMTAYRMSEVAEPYIRRRAIRHLEKGRVVIFAAGTGNPFFTTDSAAALRAAEIGAQVVLKGTNVDGVYDSDPRKNPNAVLYKHLTHREVTLKNLQVMDITAITLCFENNIPVVVFNLSKPGNITMALSGEPVGTTIEANPHTDQ